MLRGVNAIKKWKTLADRAFRSLQKPVIDKVISIWTFEDKLILHSECNLIYYENTNKDGSK